MVCEKFVGVFEICVHRTVPLSFLCHSSVIPCNCDNNQLDNWPVTLYFNTRMCFLSLLKNTLHLNIVRVQGQVQM